MIWFLAVFAASLWIVELAHEGWISSGLAATALVGLLFFGAIAAARGYGLVKVVEIGVLLASVAVFVIVASGGNPAAALQLIRPLAALAIVMLGFWILVWSVARRKK